MKRLCAIFFLFLIIITLVVVDVNKPKQNNEYLRIHIRANSNSQIDQNVKYLVKDKIVDYLTPIISSCKTKDDFENEISKNINNIECIANKVLAQNSFVYESKAYLNNEYFPTRSYDELVLEDGFYDALIIELGSGEGDNWWCVVYPPLCFLNSNANYIYKSRIQEIIKKYFGG